MIDYYSCPCNCIDCPECHPEYQDKVYCDVCETAIPRYELEVDKPYVRICKDCYNVGFRECASCGQGAELIDGAICRSCWADELEEALA